MRGMALRRSGEMAFLIAARLKAEMTGRGTRVPGGLLALVLLLFPLPSAGQVIAPSPWDGCAFFCQVGRDFKSFSTKPRTAWIVGPALGASLLIRPFDDDVSQSRINSELYPGTTLDGVLEPGEIGGGSAMQFGVAFATLGIGEISGNRRAADLGSALVRAQLVNGVMTSAMKYSVRRIRPDGSTRNSFPSGHTSGSFATATILQREFGWKAGVPAFAFATMVGASRLSENRHYLSDVVFGAAVGVASGLSIGMEDGNLPIDVSPYFVDRGMGVRVSLAMRD